MSSLPRRMARVASRAKPSGNAQLGAKLGVHNPKAADLLARMARMKREERPSLAKRPPLVLKPFNGMVSA